MADTSRIMKYTAPGFTPSVKRMAEFLGIDRETATRVKEVLTGKVNLMDFEAARKRQEQAYNSHTRLTLALEAIDQLLEGYGVEYMATKDDTSVEVFGVEYINFGDTWSPTLIYDHTDGIWRCSSWGDEKERNPRRFSE